MTRRGFLFAALGAPFAAKAALEAPAPPPSVAAAEALFPVTPDVPWELRMIALGDEIAGDHYLVRAGEKSATRIGYKSASLWLDRALGYRRFGERRLKPWTPHIYLEARERLISCQENGGGCDPLT